MPWCSQCNEVFPDGRDCPRCSSPMQDTPGVAAPYDTALPVIKIPRRLRRAFGRVDPHPRPRLSSVVFALMVFTGGVVVGHLGSLPGIQPQLRATRVAVPMNSHLRYVVQDGQDAVLVTRGLDSGTLRGLRLSSSGAFGLVSLSGSTAVLNSSSVMAVPSNGPVFGWLAGDEAAWESKDQLLIRNSDEIEGWPMSDRTPAPIPGEWTRIHQTPSGAALETGDALYLSTRSGPRQTIALAGNSHVLAVSSDADVAFVLAVGRAGFWDGTTFTPADLGPLVPEAAAFSPDGDSVAVTLRGGREIKIAAVDRTGSAVMLKSIGKINDPCPAVPVWSPMQDWVYIAPGDGSLYGFEAGGGSTIKVAVNNLGCALSWAN